MTTRQQGFSQDFIFISYFEAHNNPRTSARPGYAGLWQVLSVTKDCFWGNLEIKEIKIDFFGILRHHIRNKFIQVWFLANLAPHHLSYRNFLNTCRRKKNKKTYRKVFLSVFLFHIYRFLTMASYLYRWKKPITDGWLKPCV